MPDIQRILVHISPDNDNGPIVARASRIAMATGASVELFSSVYSASLHQAYLFDKKAELHAEHGYVKGVEAKLEQIAYLFDAQDIRVGVDVYWAQQQIDGMMRKILRFEPDLVMVAHSHHNILAELFVGDSDKRLIRECPAPLLLTRSQGWPDHICIAAGVDPLHACSEPMRQDRLVLETVQQLASVLQADMRVVHSFHTLPQAAIFDEHLATDYEGLHLKVLAEHRACLNDLLRPYALDAESAEVSVLEGEAHKVLPRYVRDIPVTILTVGHVSKGVLERVISGSTVERMLDSLECDLLVVKPPGFVCPTEYDI
ncbi:universal stress protein [Pontibacterium sp.]|uniref:universal stress protein n=1 Tax=Pontibacterium sp. TaxID=2036026 RepID=UPI0035132616